MVAAAPIRPNVILVVIDTLRADRVSGYGRPKFLTPYLASLQLRGVTFRNAYAASSWTRPSVASLFTSRYPSQHLVNSLDSVLSESETTLAEVLSAHGYTSIGFSANLNVADATGYGQGFLTFESVHGRGRKTRGPELREAALAAIDRDCKPPCFLYFQFMEPHSPYRAPRRFRFRYGRNMSLLDESPGRTCDPVHMAAVERLDVMDYEAEVAAVDLEIRRLFTELGRRGLLRSAIFIITADHGEEFLDHGGRLHGSSLYQELVRIPLILGAPGFPRYRRLDMNVSLVDLAPTVLEYLRIPVPASFEGASFASALLAPPWDPNSVDSQSPRDVIFELLGGGPMRFMQKHRAGIIRGNRKVLEGREGHRSEVYNLRRDSEELHPLANGDAALLAALDGIRRDLAKRSLAVEERREVDAETKERLRQLGYDY